MNITTILPTSFLIISLAYIYQLHSQIHTIQSQLEATQRPSEIKSLSIRTHQNFPHLSPNTTYATLPNSNDHNITNLLSNWTKYLNLNTPQIYKQQAASTIDCHSQAFIPHSDLYTLPIHTITQRAKTIITECGFLYLDNLYNTSFVDSIYTSYSTFINNTNASQPFQYPCQGKGRIEHMMPFQQPWNTSHASPYASPLLQAIIKSILGEPYKLELMTIINSKSKSLDQRWHQGWRYLFQQTERLPPTALVVTLPLKDVTMAMGGTQFCPRKKLRFYHGYRCEEPIQARTTKGTVVLFDYKTLHRGPGNDSEEDRPMVSMVFSKSWFVNVEAFVNRGITLKQTLHQRRFWEQWYWHPEKVMDYFQV